MFICIPGIVHCYPILLGGCILADLLSTIYSSICSEHRIIFAIIWAVWTFKYKLWYISSYFKSYNGSDVAPWTPSPSLCPCVLPRSRRRIQEPATAEISSFPEVAPVAITDWSPHYCSSATCHYVMPFFLQTTPTNRPTHPCVDSFWSGLSTLYLDFP